MNDASRNPDAPGGLAGTTGQVAIETAIVPYPEDGTPAVLLQLPDGHVIMRPPDAKAVAEQIIDCANVAVRSWDEIKAEFGS